MPLHQHVEGGPGKREARLTRRPAPVHDLFEMAHERQHGEHRLDEHPVLPRAALTQFEIARIALRRMEGRITQDYHASIDLSNQPLKGIICHPVFAQKCWDDKLRKKFCKALQYWLSERMKGVKLQRNHLSPTEGNLAWDRQEVLYHA